MNFENIISELILLCNESDPSWSTDEFYFADNKYKVKLSYLKFWDHKEIYLESIQRMP